MTQTLKEKIRDALIEQSEPHINNPSHCTDAILSVIAESVEPMKWDISGKTCFAETEIKGYSVSPSMTTDGYRLITSGNGLTYHPTRDAAKAAAQADYNRRILSALGLSTPEQEKGE